MKTAALFFASLLLTGCMADRYITPIGNTIDAVVVLPGGTGTFISDKGHILTAAHLFPPKYDRLVNVKVRYSDITYKATVLHIDRNVDLALLKINADIITPHVAVAPIYSTKVGQEVYVIGHPFNLFWTVTTGTISATDRIGMARGLHLQTNAAINSGNSGGPVLNLNGELLGVASFITSPDYGNVGLGFAVSLEEVHTFLEQFRGF